MQEKDVILIPTYNERENIQLLIPEIFALLPNIHILVIDDNSPDQTGKEVEKLMEKYSNLHLYSRAKKEGLGKAYIDAFKKVLGWENVRSIITMDADGSHSVEHLPVLIKELNKADVVIGSRYTAGGGIENWEIWRQNLSKYGNIYARVLTGLPIKDLTAGFICIKTETLKNISLSSIGTSGYAFLIDLKFYLIYSGKAKVKEIPIIFKNRREGESKMSRHIIIEGLKTPLRLFFKRMTKIT